MKKEMDGFQKSCQHETVSRYFKIADITVHVTGDLDLQKAKFTDALIAFETDGPGDDNITLRHHFELPVVNGEDLGKEIYRNPPWAISLKDGNFWYKGILPGKSDKVLHRLAVFNSEYSMGKIYSPSFELERIYNTGFDSLSLFPTDQIWIAQLLADRNAALIHSAGAIVNGCGMLFVGHSGAGKSTTMALLKTAHQKMEIDVEILCDDRNVIRKRQDGWHLYGTWSHGDIADVSASETRIKAIFFLEQAPDNRITFLSDRKKIWQQLLATLIRPVVSVGWWEKELDVLQQVIDEIPCFTMQFDNTGKIVKELNKMAR
jgi:hypothetical protein